MTYRFLTLFLLTAPCCLMLSPAYSSEINEKEVKIINKKQDIQWSEEKEEELITRINNNDIDAYDEFALLRQYDHVSDRSLNALTIKSIPKEILEKKDDTTAFYVYLMIRKFKDSSLIKTLEELSETNSYAMAYYGYLSKKYRFTYHQFSANENNPVGQHALGLDYYNGHGTEKNIEKALEYFQQSSNQKNGMGDFCLGYYYFYFEYSNNVKFDKYSMAFEYFNESAEQRGISPAQYFVGIMNYFGQGTKQNTIKGFKYFLDAANSQDNNNFTTNLKKIATLESDEKIIDKDVLKSTTDNINTLKNFINEINDQTIYWMGLSESTTNGFEDISSFCLSDLNKNAKSLINFYTLPLTLLENLFDPLFAISCLDVKDIKLKQHLYTDKISKKEYLSFLSLKESMENYDVESVKALSLIEKIEKPLVKFINHEHPMAYLEGIQDGNESLYNDIYAIVQPYLDQKNTISTKDKEKLTTFFENFKQSLLQQKTFFDGLTYNDQKVSFKDYFDIFLDETSSYRDNLFIKKYKNAFN